MKPKVFVSKSMNGASKIGVLNGFISIANMRQSLIQTVGSFVIYHNITGKRCKSKGPHRQLVSTLIYSCITRVILTLNNLS